MSRAHVGRAQVATSVDKVGSATFMPENLRNPQDNENF